MDWTGWVRTVSGVPEAWTSSSSSPLPVETGTGFLSPLLRVVVEGVPGRPGGLWTWLLKGPPRAPALSALRLHERECLFYRSWAAGARCPTPRCVSAGDNDGRWLVLEEVSGAATPSLAAGIPVDVAEEAVREIAAVHATSRRRGHERSAWDALTGTPDCYGDKDAAPGWAGPFLIEAFLAQWTTVARPELTAVDEDGDARDQDGVSDVVEAEAVDAWVARHTDMATATLPLRPATCLVHGDLWSNNLLVDCTTGRLRAVLDWQFAGWGVGMDDVAWLLVSSVAPAERRAHTTTLLSAYVDAYNAVQRSDGGVPDPLWTLADAQAAYRVSLAAACLQLGASADAFFTPDLAPNVRAAYRARFRAAFADALDVV